jgi:hypothetical protein
MKPLLPGDLVGAVVIDGRGRRSPQTQLLIDERNKLLVEAARHFGDVSDREAARMLRSRIAIYRDGRWRRDRVELKCPLRLVGHLEATLWMVLKVRDHVPSEITIRRAIRDPRDLVH